MKSYLTKTLFRVRLTPFYMNKSTHGFSVTHAAPIYLREHGKRMLRGALWNDTNFLQSVNVMDYSLLVGVDDQSNELVLGVVGK